MRFVVKSRREQRLQSPRLTGVIFGLFVLLRAPIISISVEDFVACKLGDSEKVGSSRDNKVTHSKFSMTLLLKSQKSNF